MKRLFLLILFIAFVVAFSRGYPSLLRGLGRYLIYETPLQPADAILVLSGGYGTPARVLQAVDLYRQGYAKRIILTSEVKPDGYEHLALRGIQLPTSLDLSLMVLRRLGIPRKDVDVIDREADSTLHELCGVKAFLDGRGWRSLLLVTHKWHSRRAVGVMALLTNGKVHILSRPTTYDDFQVEGWWKRRRNFKEIVVEYQKLLDYWRIALMAKLLSALDQLPFIRISVQDYLCPAKVG